MEDKDYIDVDFRVYLNNIFSFLWENKLSIISITSIAAIFSIYYALNITNVYTSKSTLVPTSISESPQGGMGGLSALTNIAGLETESSKGQNLIARELLKSTEFINKFVIDNDILVPLMAAEGWNSETNELIINTDIYSEGKWQRKPSGLYDSSPSADEIYQQFTARFSFLQDRDGVIKVSFTFFSPYLGRDYLTNLIDAVNLEVRKRDISEATLKKEHLIIQREGTKQINISKLFANLIETEIKTIMLAEVKDNYVYSIVDAPSTPLSRSGVPRSIICIFITLSGFFLSLIFVIIKSLIKR